MAAISSSSVSSVTPRAPSLPHSVREIDAAFAAARKQMEEAFKHMDAIRSAPDETTRGAILRSDPLLYRLTQSPTAVGKPLSEKECFRYIHSTERLLPHILFSMLAYVSDTPLPLPSREPLYRETINVDQVGGTQCKLPMEEVQSSMMAACRESSAPNEHTIILTADVDERAGAIRLAFGHKGPGKLWDGCKKIPQETPRDSQAEGVQRQHFLVLYFMECVHIRDRTQLVYTKTLSLLPAFRDFPPGLLPLISSYLEKSSFQPVAPLEAPKK